MIKKKKKKEITLVLTALAECQIFLITIVHTRQYCQSTINTFLVNFSQQIITGSGLIFRFFLLLFLFNFQLFNNSVWLVSLFLNISCRLSVKLRHSLLYCLLKVTVHFPTSRTEESYSLNHRITYSLHKFSLAKI